ncbi:DUF262 domain-containing protein [Agromyces sp. NPDC004153]
MEAHPRSPRALFEGKEHYEIPAFQRPYVWNEEDQWAPLWGDVVRVAESYIKAKESDSEPSIPHHFLGAVVYESRPPVAGDVTRHDVIDGQQRMTTLQLLIDAVQEEVSAHGHDIMAEALEDLILNRSAAFRGKRERFKLWPSQADREAFEHAMDPRQDWQSGEHRIREAHAFFRREAAAWLQGRPDDDGVLPPGSEALRVEALSSTLQDRLVLIAIDLTGHDDSQLIFETLNDRGTPLLKADLIKNWIFRKGSLLGADVERWAETYWQDFDTVWWREEIRQGRLTRSRVDIFLQYWLTMRLQVELKAEDVFRGFATFADKRMTNAAAADDLLRTLKSDADTYRSFAQLDDTTPEGLFYSRVIETMELAATTPVFLWFLSRNHNVPADQRQRGIEALESWAIRRTLLRLTTKDVNKFMVAVLRVLSESDASAAGEALFAFLSAQTAETRYWPTNSDMVTTLPGSRIYGNIRQWRLRVILGAVEDQLRAQSTMHETLSVPKGLEIEHIMPQGWRTHWDSEPKLLPEEAARRDLLVNTLGNLTLVTKSLNGSLSNRPWTDSAAVGLAEGGEAGRGKRSLLDKFSLLVLNKSLLDGHDDSWTETDIQDRSLSLIKSISQIWPGPAEELRPAPGAEARPRGLRLADLTDLDAVDAAIGEFDRIGREAFLACYGFGEAREYFLVTETGRYDSKAIFAAAWKNQHGEALKPADFSGGIYGAAQRLADLGYVIDGID